eukprot:jgi/Chlat1/4904/Chrsp31S04822
MLLEEAGGLVKETGGDAVYDDEDEGESGWPSVGVVGRSAGGVLCYNGRALPNLFIIGGQKCGSTTLWEYLVSPEFGRGAVLKTSKEMHFIDHPHPRTPHEWLAAYASHYPNCTDPTIADGRARYVLDGTPILQLSPRMPLEIGVRFARHGAVDDLRFLVSLRDPVQRTLSWFGHIGRRYGWHYNITCTMTFDEWVAREVPVVRACMAQQQNLSPAQVHEKCRGEGRVLLDSWYAVQLEPWLQLFGPKRQLHIVDFEHLTDTNSTSRALQKVLEFLSIDHSSPLHITSSLQANPGLLLDLEHPGCPAPSMSPSTASLLYDFYRPLTGMLRPLLERYGMGEAVPGFAVRAEEGGGEGGEGEGEGGDGGFDPEEVDVGDDLDVEAELNGMD